MKRAHVGAKLLVPLVAVLCARNGRAAGESAAIVSFDVQPQRILLERPYDACQLLVTGMTAEGEERDLTRELRVVANELVAVDERGFVRPLKRGEGTLELVLGERHMAVPITVGELEAASSPSFVRDVMPVLSRSGCNAGTCHGSANGKNGFKLSLRGYDPSADHAALTDDLAGRRFDRVDPAESLMLRKPTGRTPHEGGAVVASGSRAERILLDWIREGAERDQLARPSRIELLPAAVSIADAGQGQQIVVLAHYADGSRRDVTREAFVESSDSEIVRSDDRALVTALRRGEAAVLARYEGCYAAAPVFVMGERTGFQPTPRPVHNYVDELVDEKLARIRADASPLCSDEEFLRRIHLDLTGLLPSPKAVRAFLLDQRDSRQKREEVIERLLGNPEYVDYWTNKWADLLQVNSKFLGAEGARRFHGWIQAQIASNRPYDAFVADILAASGSTYENPPASYYKILRKPDVVMENTTQLFLGVRFNCNKCHDHPFERWTRSQHWQLASFFAQVGRRNAPGAQMMPLERDNRPEEALAYEEIIEDLSEGDARDETSGIVYSPKFPYEHAGRLPEQGTRRARLVAWLTAPENPYFATSFVNRVWSYFLGQGLIEPVDDLRAGNPPTNPELLRRLTEDFVEHGFDVRHLMRTICRSRTYQLALATTPWNLDDDKSFSHARARRLGAEVLYDALCQATGTPSRLPGMLPGERAVAVIDPSTRLPDGFLDLFGRPPRESACECERSSGMSLGQALSLVNGPTVSDLVREPGNRLADLARLTAEPRRILDELYLSFLGRLPTADEAGALLPMLDVRAPENLVALAPEQRSAMEAELRAYEASLHLAAWHPTQLVDAHSSGGAAIERGPDGSLRVLADKLEKDSQTLVLWTDLEHVTGLRLEALRDDALPNGGPGLADSNGNFVLNELRLTAVPSDEPGAARVLAFAAATSDYSQPGFPVENAVDGKPETGWAVDPPSNRDHVAVFQLAEPIESRSGTTLILSLDQLFGGKHIIGRLRVSVTDSEGPIRYSGLAASVERAFLVEASQRSPEARRLVWQHYVDSHPVVAQAIRLGATQDLAWALANSPAFLFNH